MKINLLPGQFVNKDGTFNQEKALQLSGKIAGVCYNKEGFHALENEPVESTNQRIKLTLDHGHHSVYDHISIQFNFEYMPKILAMVLNNENQYTTSEKSGRYTKIVRNEKYDISEEEEILYNKWMDIFRSIIKETYGDVFNDSKIDKLAQENSRYLVSIFMPTHLVHTTTLRQINCIVSWMVKYMEEADQGDTFQKRLSDYMQEFIDQLEQLGILVKELMTNEKSRSLSLFANDIEQREEYFGDGYAARYKASLVMFAHLHRHRTLHYEIALMKEKEYYIPEVLKDHQELVDEWLSDLKSVAHLTPQAELIQVYERGIYEHFILKVKERLCSVVFLETMHSVMDLLTRYHISLEEKNHPLADDLKGYMKGARCTFKGYTCPSQCNFKEGINLTRKI